MKRSQPYCEDSGGKPAVVSQTIPLVLMGVVDIDDHVNNITVHCSY